MIKIKIDSQSLSARYVLERDIVIKKISFSQNIKNVALSSDIENKILFSYVGVAGFNNTPNSRFFNTNLILKKGDILRILADRVRIPANEYFLFLIEENDTKSRFIKKYL